MSLKPLSKEVYVSDEPIVRLTREDVEFLKNKVAETPRGRVRLCAHKGNDNLLHEMVIVLSRGTYIRPHKHLSKSESFHIIEGAVDIAIMDDAGAVTEVIQLSDYPSGKQFYYRIADPIFHTLLIRSELLVIHETTNGPFTKGDAIFASWAPDEADAAAAQKYMETVASSAAALMRHA
jgi:cupin fold WbuC family metalloprotein